MSTLEALLISIIVWAAIYVVLRPHLKRSAAQKRVGAASCSSACSGCASACETQRGSRTPAKFLAWLLVLGLAGQAPALDTTEAFDLGFSDAEYYAALEGLGRGGSDRELCNEMVLGFGLTHRLSGSLSACVAADQERFAGETSLGFGLFANVYESVHFDADLMLDVGAMGDGLGALSLGPTLEINYDRHPDQRSWGLYVRMGVFGSGQSTREGGEEMPDARIFDAGLNPGFYWSVNPTHQVLVEYDAAMGIGEARVPGEDTHGIGIGWNALLGPSIELISQLRRAVMRGSGDSTWGLSVGFIATLPAGN